MWPSVLEYVAARYAFGLATGDELVRCADTLLDAGVYSQALGDLFTLHQWDVAWKASPLFAQALNELGRRPPANAHAALALIRYHLIEILEGRVTPFDGYLRFMNHCYWQLAWSDRAQWFDRDSSRSREFFNLAYAYDHVDIDDTRRSIIDIDILRFARDWLREREAARFPSNWLTWNDATVPRLARRIRDERRFGDLPILADAFEEAGCADEDLLIHLRSAGPHLRACWIVELLTS